MCSGGSPPRATITKPDYSAYNRMAEMQFSAMQKVQDMGLTRTQNELAAALSNKEEKLSTLRDLKVTAANETAANAARLAALMGPPRPEKTAQSPVLAYNRTGMERAQGKKQVKIDLRLPAKA